MRFFLFIIANALLFIRPSELFPELNAVEIYRYFILACLAVSLPIVLQQFSLRYAGVPPILWCVVFLLPAVFLSGLFHGNLNLIMETVTEFAKVVIYFLLLLALVIDMAKLRQFLYALGLFSAFMTLIAVVRYHADSTPPVPPTESHLANATNTGSATSASDPANKAKLNGTFVVDEVRDPQTGSISYVRRICGTGIFNDPNDLALVVVTAIPLGLYWLTDPTRKATRPLWLIVILLCGYALMLTHSRGGFIAFLTGLVTLFHLRFGGKKTLLVGVVFMPVLFAVFAGRMTTISTDEGTAQTRIQLWSEAFEYFRQSPLVGIGMDNYRQFSSHIAHNAFIHCYTELGVVGGTLFLGAFYLALSGLYQVRPRAPLPDEQDVLDPELRRLHPYLMAMLVAYTVGICFLSRNYVVPTYMLLGLAVVFMRLHSAQIVEPLTNWNRGVWTRLAGVSFAFLIASNLFVRIFVQWH